MSDLIDLTADDEVPGIHRKRPAEKAFSGVIEQPNELWKQQKVEHDPGKARIMAFASKLNKERGITNNAPHTTQQRTEVSSFCEQKSNKPPTVTDLVDSEVVILDSDESAPNGRNEEDRSAEASTTSIPETNRLLAQLHAERLARQSRQANADVSATAASSSRAFDKPSVPSTFSLLSYNVWFAEEVALKDRVAAIGNCITEYHLPAFVCFQEMTHNIYRLMQQSDWWQQYTGSPMPPAGGCPYFTVLLYNKQQVHCTKVSVEIPYDNSVMGRGLRSLRSRVCGVDVIVATTHLESPTGPSAMFSAPRVAQCTQALQVLDSTNVRDVVFAGDMNWNTKDGQVPLPHSWIDCWSQLHPTEAGYTYDGKTNLMLGPYNTLQGRLDRVFCKLSSFRLESIEMVGRDALPGVTYTKNYRGTSKKLPVLPSDHYGLLATFTKTG